VLDTGELDVVAEARQRRTFMGVVSVPAMELLAVAVGAVLALLSGMATELWHARRRTRVAAKLLTEEFEFNGARLGIAMMGDAQGAQYELKFRTADWQASRDGFLIGAPPEAAQSVSKWYAMLGILGAVLRHDTGPQRQELVFLFNRAHEAVLQVARVTGADRADAEAQAVAPAADAIAAAARACGAPAQPPSEPAESPGAGAARAARPE
jgi:hypothetical protein